MDMEINFPNLGIYLDRVGKNISIFGFSIAYYGIVIVTGMMIAIWIAQREAKRTGQSPDMYVDFIIYALIFAIIGARLYYVIFRIVIVIKEWITQELKWIYILDV